MNGHEWQGGTVRGDRPLFGESATLYDDVRPGYDATLVAAVLEYASNPERAAEIGAGTGKATSAFASAGVQVLCVEPDPAMSRKIEHRFVAGNVHVTTCAFEDWKPTEKVPLIYCAQAWHWLEPETRCSRAARALISGGTLALFGHRYLFADPDVEARVDDAYKVIAPELLGNPELRRVPADSYWYADELRASSDFTDVRTADLGRIVSYDIETYLLLVATFSSHRELDPNVLHRLVEGIRRAVDDDHVEVDLATVLALGRVSTP